MSKVSRKDIEELEGKFIELEKEWNEVREQSKAITPRGSFSRIPSMFNDINSQFPRRLSSSSPKSSLFPTPSSISPLKSATSSPSSVSPSRETSVHKSKSSLSDFPNLLHTTSTESFFKSNGSVNPKKLTQFNRSTNNGVISGDKKGNLKGERIGVRNSSYTGKSESASINNFNTKRQAYNSYEIITDLYSTNGTGDSSSKTGRRIMGKIAPFSKSPTRDNNSGSSDDNRSSVGNGNIIQQKMDGFVFFTNSPAAVIKSHKDNVQNCNLKLKSNSSDKEILNEDILQVDPKATLRDTPDNIEIIVDNSNYIENDINAKNEFKPTIPYSSPTPIPSSSHIGVDTPTFNNNTNDTLLPKFCWKCGLDLRKAKVPPKFCKECGSKIIK